MKTTPHISLNPSIWNKAEKKYGKRKVSSRIETLLKFDLSHSPEDFEKEILQKEVLELEEQQKKIDNELFEKKTILQRIIDKEKEKEKEILKQKKKQLEEAQKCLSCGEKILDPSVAKKFPNGLLCSLCWENKSFDAKILGL